MHKWVDITQYGAKTDGTLCTKPIQQAIDDCFMSGGGVVVIPGGTFRTGSVRLRSNVTLYLMKNARLEGSTDPEDYADYINDTVEPINPRYITEDRQTFFLHFFGLCGNRYPKEKITIIQDCPPDDGIMP